MAEQSAEQKLSEDQIKREQARIQKQFGSLAAKVKTGDVSASSSGSASTPTPDVLPPSAQGPSVADILKKEQRKSKLSPETEELLRKRREQREKEKTAEDEDEERRKRKEAIMQRLREKKAAKDSGAPTSGEEATITATTESAPAEVAVPEISTHKKDLDELEQQKLALQEELAAMERAKEEIARQKQDLIEQQRRLDEERAKAREQEEAAKALAEQKQLNDEKLRQEQEKDEDNSRLLREKEAELLRLQKERDEERARIEQEKETEVLRLKAQQEEERARLEQEKEAERQRLEAEKQRELARIAEEKEQERLRIIAEREAEREELERELAALKEEKNRLAREKEEAERERQAKEQALEHERQEKARLAQESAAREQERQQEQQQAREQIQRAEQAAADASAAAAAAVASAAAAAASSPSPSPTPSSSSSSSSEWDGRTYFDDPSVEVVNFELELLREINSLRRDPKAYAQGLRERLSWFHDPNDLLVYKPPGADYSIQMKEGKSAVEAAIRSLESALPTAPLWPVLGLSRSCGDLVKTNGARGVLGDTLPDGTTAAERLVRYGQWEGKVMELLSYGPRSNVAADVVAQWVIDDGNVDRRQQLVLLDGEFTRVGLAGGVHSHFDFMAVVAVSRGFHAA